MALTKVSGGILQQPIDVGIITATSIQVGSGTTIHDAGIDLGSGNITSHNINSTGIITATSFVGPVTGNSDTASNLTGSPSITVTNITASGNVSIAGTLTYEDVTNIDSVGVITARNGIDVTGGSVGVGTDNPLFKLQVNHADEDGLQLRTANTAASFINFSDGDDNDVGQISYDHATNHLGIRVNAAERLRIKSDGIVGVGTIGPSVVTGTGLHIAGDSAGLKLQNLNNGDWIIFC